MNVSLESCCKAYVGVVSGAVRHQDNSADTGRTIDPGPTSAHTGLHNNIPSFPVGRDSFSGNRNFRRNLLNHQDQTALTREISPGIWRIMGCSTAALVVYFSLNPAHPLKHSVAQIPFSDAIIHLGSFALVTFCFYLSTKHKLLQLSMGSGLMMLALALKILQSVIFGIDPEAEDSVANMAGVVVGYLVANRISRVTIA